MPTYVDAPWLIERRVLAVILFQWLKSYDHENEMVVEVTNLFDFVRDRELKKKSRQNERKSSLYDFIGAMGLEWRKC